MEMQWCWRCKTLVPMFDEAEFPVLRDLYAECLRATKEFRQRYALPLDHCDIAILFRPLLDLHEEMTGIRETNHNAIIHHGLALYGHPCKRCGKLLRRPTTTKCFECGEPNDFGR